FQTISNVKLKGEGILRARGGTVLEPEGRGTGTDADRRKARLCREAMYLHRVRPAIDAHDPVAASPDHGEQDRAVAAPWLGAAPEQFTAANLPRNGFGSDLAQSQRCVSAAQNMHALPDPPRSRGFVGSGPHCPRQSRRRFG